MLLTLYHENTYGEFVFDNNAELLVLLKTATYTGAVLTINSEDMECFKLFMHELPSTNIKILKLSEDCTLSDEETAIVFTDVLQSQVEDFEVPSLELLGKLSNTALFNFLPHSKLKSFVLLTAENYNNIWIAKAVKALPKGLETLILSLVDGQVSLTTMALAEILPSSDLKSIALGSQNDCEENSAMNAFIAAIPSSKLEHLSLYSIKKFGDKDVISLANILPESKLVSLRLDGCGIGSVGAIALLNALQKSKIEDLTLSYNNIGPEIAEFFNNLQQPLELENLRLRCNPMGDDFLLSLVKANKFLHISNLELIDGYSSYSKEILNDLFTALKDNYAILCLGINDCNELEMVFQRNRGLRLLAEKFNDNEYLSAGEIEPLLRVIEDKSIDVAYINKARERMYLATEFLGDKPSSDLRDNPNDIYKRHFDLICDGGFESLALTVTNFYFKGSIKLSSKNTGDKDIATKVFDLFLNSGELKPALKNSHTALFIADKLNDQGDDRSSAEKIDTITVNLAKIQKSNNAVAFFKDHPRKIGGFLVMSTEKLEGILTSVFESKYAYKALSAEPDLLFHKYGIRLLKAETKVKELENNTGNKRSDSFVEGVTRDREEGAKKPAPSI